ncbi:MAG: nicotinate phosphoribosyltransferase, partial [Nocardioidaceae bacterium]
AGSVHLPDIPLISVAKRSTDKVTLGGRKWALRRRGPDGIATGEIIGVGHRPVDDGDDRPLLLPLVEQGVMVGRETLQEARKRHEQAMAELPVTRRKLSRGEPALDTMYVGEGSVSTEQHGPL